MDSPWSQYVFHIGNFPNFFCWARQNFVTKLLLMSFKCWWNQTPYHIKYTFFLLLFFCYILLYSSKFTIIDKEEHFTLVNKRYLTNFACYICYNLDVSIVFLKHPTLYNSYTYQLNMNISLSPMCHSVWVIFLPGAPDGHLINEWDESCPACPARPGLKQNVPVHASWGIEFRAQARYSYFLPNCVWSRACVLTRFNMSQLKEVIMVCINSNIQCSELPYSAV